MRGAQTARWHRRAHNDQRTARLSHGLWDAVLAGFGDTLAWDRVHLGTQATAGARAETSVAGMQSVGRQGDPSRITHTHILGSPTGLGGYS
jgi:hypothetical protein